MKKSEKTRQFIIEKTAPIFNKKGIAGTTLTDLTDATGLTKGSIYGNFKDKNTVAVAAYDYNVDMLLEYLNRAMEQHASSVDKLLSITEAYRRLYRNMIAFGGCPIANTATEADDTHPELRDRVTETVKRMTRMIEALLEAGKRVGEFQHLIDSGKTAEIIISLIEGGTILSKATGHKGFIMNSLEQVDHLIHSISKQQ